MVVVLIIVAIIVGLVIAASVVRASQGAALATRMASTINATAKLKSNIDMFRQSISADRLMRGASNDDLHYYIGYIAALARAIAAKDGVSSDGVILASVQMEASRLFGTSITENGDYSEGIEILPRLLANPGAVQGIRDGTIDGQYVVEPSNPGPYFESLRARFGVKI